MCPLNSAFEAVGRHSGLVVDVPVENKLVDYSAVHRDCALLDWNNVVDLMVGHLGQNWYFLCFSIKHLVGLTVGHLGQNWNSLWFSMKNLGGFTTQDCMCWSK